MEGVSADMHMHMYIYVKSFISGETVQLLPNYYCDLRRKYVL